MICECDYSVVFICAFPYFVSCVSFFIYIRGDVDALTSTMANPHETTGRGEAKFGTRERTRVMSSPASERE